MIGRWLAAGVAVLLMAVAAYSWRSDKRAPLLLPAPVAMRPVQAAATPLEPPEAAAEAPLDREAKRLRRYDKDDDGEVSRDEYLAARRKNYDKLDVNHDGVLSFAEYSVKAGEKFADADADKSGRLSAGEFAKTAAPRKAKKAVACPPSAEADT